jgi:hypothetical protein
MTDALPSLRNELALIGQSPTARKTLDLPRMQQLLDTFPKANFERDEVRMVWHFSLTYAISLGYFLRSHESAHGTSPASGFSPDFPAVVTAS